MKRKIRLRSVILDLLITALCLAAFYFSLTNFYRVLNRNTVRDDVTRIGTIEYKYKIAQRKFSDRVVWERLQQQSALYNGDYLRTTSGALATIIFNNDSRLELGENTMLQILLNEDGDFVIELDSGAVSLETNNVTNNAQLELKTKSGNSVILQSGSSFSAVTNQNGQTDLTVIQGQAVILDQAGLEKPMEEGQTFVQNENGQITKKAISAPAVPSRILNFEEKAVEVPFNLNVTEEYKNTDLVIETSANPDFNPLDKTYTKTSNQDFSIPASEGKVYWRVYPKNDAENKTSGSVDIIQVPQITLASPATGSEFTFTKEPLLLNFVWYGNDYVSFYNFQLATDQNFKNLVREEKVYSTKYSFSFEQQGNFYWRVIPYYEVSGLGYKDPSNVHTFTVKKDAESNFAGPSLIYPVRNTKVTTQKEDGQLTFIWESPEKYDSYKLIVAKTKDYSSPVVNVTTKELLNIQELTEKRFPEGTYYWKVIASSKNLDHPLESKSGSFIVENKKENTAAASGKNEVVEEEFLFPEDLAEMGEKSAMQVVLEKAHLEEIVEAAENPLEKAEIAKAEEQKKENEAVKPEEKKEVASAKPAPVKKPAAKPKPKPAPKPEPKPEPVPEPEVVVPETEPEPEVVVPEPEPVVQSVPEPQQENQTQPETVTEPPKPQLTLEDPVLLEPVANFVIGTDYIKSNNRKIVFIWKAVENATDYSFELYQILEDGSKQRIVQQKNLIEPTAEVTDLSKLTNGIFEWRVTAYNHTGNVDTTIHSKQIVSAFKIQIGLPTKVTPINPGKQYGE